jgi:tetratricopeptide (TPR) repeat protein
MPLTEFRRQNRSFATIDTDAADRQPATGVATKVRTRVSRGGHKHQKVKRLINLPLLVGTLVAVAVVGPTAYLWHARQITRTAESLLGRADALEQAKDWTAAADMVQRYVRLKPTDVAAQVRLVRAYDKSAGDFARKQRAVGLYYETLGVASASGEISPGEIAALRGRLVELLVELQRFAPAEMEAVALRKESEALLQADPQNSPALELRATAARSLAFARYGLFRNGTRASVVSEQGDSAPGSTGSPLADILGRTFFQALELNANDRQLARQMADICREQPQIRLDASSGDARTAADVTGPAALPITSQPQVLDQAARDALADQTMDHMVAANPDDALAYLARHLYRTQYKSPGADEDLARAIEIAPMSLEVCLTAAEAARRKAVEVDDQAEKNRLVGEVKKFCATAIKSTPGDVRAYLLLGQMHTAEGQPQQAIEVLQQGLTDVGEHNLDLNLLLAETLVDLGQFEQASAPLKVVQDQLERVGPQLARADRLALQRRADLLAGRWNAGVGKYSNALPALNRVATLGEQVTPAEQRERFLAVYYLGQCYARLGNWERAAKTFDDAAMLRPDLAAPHLAAAEAWTQVGQPSAVVPHLEQAVQLDGSSENWLALAQAHLQKQALILPRKDRDWEPFEAALQEAQSPDRKTPLTAPWRAGLLEVQSILLRATTADDQPQAIERAKTVLARLQTENPDAAVMWRSIALVYQQLGDRESADRAFARFAEIQPAGDDRYIVRSQLLAARREFDAARKEIYDGLAAVPSTESAPLQFALVAISLREGRNDQAATELAELQKSQPKNRRILQQLADMAFERSDWKALEQWEVKLEEVEGPTGLYWRYNRARRLLAQAHTAQNDAFVEAVRLAGEIRAERPNWPPAALLSAMTLQRCNRRSEAIEAYQEAIRLGERRLSIFEALISLLYSAGRLDDAESYLAQLQEYVPVQEGLSGLEILTTATQGRTEEAVQAARRGIERRPTDAMAHLWLGQVLAIDGQQAEAEVALRRAIELAPNAIWSYSGLIMLYLRTNRLDDTRRLLGELEANNGLPAGQKEFVLAQVFEQMRDREAAEAHYRLALQLEPANVALLTRMALFLPSARAAEAEQLLRTAMEKDPNAAGPRRALAALLAAEEQWAEALQLLTSQDKSTVADVSDRRLKAGLLVQRGGRENLAEAQRILEALIADPQTVDSDRLLLARLFEAQAALFQSEARRLAVGNKTTDAESRRTEAAVRYVATRRQYMELTMRNDVKPQYLGAFAEFLMRQRDYAQAEQVIAELSKRVPDDLTAAGLRARLLQATDRGDQIAAMLEPIAAKRLAALQKEGKDAPEAVLQAEEQLALTVGRIYVSAQQYAAAEPWLRRVAEKKPSAYGPLAVCLAAQRRMQEAVQLCLQARAADSSFQPVLTLASLMLLGTASQDDFQTVEPNLVDAVSAHPDEARLVSAVADVRAVQGKLDDAIRLYEQALKVQPNNVLVMNNLATILGEQPNQHDKAREYIDRAIELAGPSPPLLDTKGMILFHAGDYANARVCLEAATWDPEADPRFFFHLAAAYLRLGDTDRSRKAYEHATTHQFQRQVLTPSDQALLTELERAFPRQPPGSSSVSSVSRRGVATSRCRVFA